MKRRVAPVLVCSMRRCALIVGAGYLQHAPLEVHGTVIPDAAPLARRRGRRCRRPLRGLWRQRKGMRSHETNASNSAGQSHCFCLLLPRSGGLTSRQGSSSRTRRAAFFDVIASANIMVKAVQQFADVLPRRGAARDLPVEVIAHEFDPRATDRPHVVQADDRQHVDSEPSTVAAKRLDSGPRDCRASASASATVSLTWSRTPPRSRVSQRTSAAALAPASSSFLMSAERGSQGRTLSRLQGNARVPAQPLRAVAMLDVAGCGSSQWCPRSAPGPVPEARKAKGEVRLRSESLSAGPRSGPWSSSGAPPRGRLRPPPRGRSRSSGRPPGSSPVAPGRLRSREAPSRRR